MAGGHEEVDPIKSNPDSHKALGVAAMVCLLGGLGYWLAGSPYSGRISASGAPSAGVSDAGRISRCAILESKSATCCPAGESESASDEPTGVGDADPDAPLVPSSIPQSPTP